MTVQPPPKVEPDFDPVTESAAAHAEAKALALIVMCVILLTSFTLYIMSARGVFAPTQQLVLVAYSAEGVVEGMTMSFAGFPIGRVTRIELADDGRVNLHLAIPSESAKWLRVSSVFTLERGPLGDARLRAFSGVLADPPLEDGAHREVLIGDASAGVPQLVATAKQVMENLERLTAEGQALRASLENARQITDRMTGRYGVLGGLLGNDDNAQQVVASITNANALIAQANIHLFGNNGLSSDVQAGIGEATALLREARLSLQKVDTLLDDAKIVASNARVASDDLDALRYEVEKTLRRVSGLVDDINRRWPIARDPEIRLP